jgi:hypothetical protein
MNPIKEFQLYETGLLALSDETVETLGLHMGMGTDAESALDDLLHTLQVAGYDVTGVESSIKERWRPTEEEGEYHLYILIGGFPPGLPTLYQKVYALNWDDEYKSLRALRKEANDLYKDALRAEQKKRQPRARVHFKPLPDEVVGEIRDSILEGPLVREINRLEAELKAEQARRKTLLAMMADGIEPKHDNCMHRVSTSSSYTYNSQGYGAMGYAKGELEPWLDMLEAMGFDCHIREVNYKPPQGMFGCGSADYELWANCPEWMFDALSRGLSLDTAIDSMKRRGRNPLVYNPFLGERGRF